MSAREPRLMVPELHQRRLDLEERAVRKEPSDFADLEGQNVLGAATRALARELGRQAARELWEKVVRR